MDKKKVKELIKEFKTGKTKNGYEIGKHFFELQKYKKALIYFEGYLNSKDYIYESYVSRCLGDIYYQGLGVKKDGELALEYYCKVYSNNDNSLNKLIADEYYYGRNVKKNPQKAHEYYNKLAKNGDVDAIEKCIDYSKDNKPYMLYTYYKLLYEANHDSTAKLFVATSAFLNFNVSSKDIDFQYKLLLELESTENKDVLFSLGSIYYEGYLGSKNIKKALEYFEKAYKLGSKHAAAYLGRYYYDGQIVDKDIKKGANFFNESQHVSNYARYRLGRHMLENPFMGRKSDITDGYNMIKFVSSSVGEASCYMARLLREKKYDVYSYFDRPRLVEDAIRLKCIEGYVERGYISLENKQYDKAFADFKFAYENGVKEAALPYSKCFSEGLGVKKDEQKAQEILGESKDSNVIYLKAKALMKEKNYKDAIELLQSIVNENVDAKYELALIYIEDKRVKNQLNLGYKYLCELREINKNANCKRLICLYRGIGVKADPYNAMKELLKAPYLDGEANYVIAEAYETGKGVNKSLELALKYYTNASSKKYSKANAKVDELKLIIQANNIIKAKEAKEAEEKKKQEKMIQELLAKARKEELERLYQKHRYTRIDVPSFIFPIKNNSLPIKYGSFAYGKLDCNYELNWNEKKAYINVTGKIQFVGFMSKSQISEFNSGLDEQIKKIIESFLEKEKDYPFNIARNYDYIYEYEY